jgi:hypothetical protein
MFLFFSFFRFGFYFDFGFGFVSALVMNPILGFVF